MMDHYTPEHEAAEEEGEIVVDTTEETGQNVRRKIPLKGALKQTGKPVCSALCEATIMAIYHCSVKLVKRSAGRSATAAAAYRSGDRIIDQRTGEIHDYTRRSGVESTELVFPDHVTTRPNRETLWNTVETAETRKNAQVAREVEIALPDELTVEQRRALAVDFAQSLAEQYRVAADVCIHKPGKEGDHRNHHAHIMLTTREIMPDGEMGAKTRILDDRKTGPAEILKIREMWAQVCNAALEQAGETERIDHRSLRDQGEERQATKHQGPAVTAIERKHVAAVIRQEFEEGDLRVFYSREEYAQKRRADGNIPAVTRIGEINQTIRELERLAPSGNADDRLLERLGLKTATPSFAERQTAKMSAQVKDAEQAVTAALETKEAAIRAVNETQDALREAEERIKAQQAALSAAQDAAGQQGKLARQAAKLWGGTKLDRETEQATADLELTKAQGAAATRDHETAVETAQAAETDLELAQRRLEELRTTEQEFLRAQRIIREREAKREREQRRAAEQREREELEKWRASGQAEKQIQQHENMLEKWRRELASLPPAETREEFVRRAGKTASLESDLRIAREERRPISHTTVEQDSSNARKQAERKAGKEWDEAEAKRIAVKKAAEYAERQERRRKAIVRARRDVPSLYHGKEQRRAERAARPSSLQHQQQSQGMER